MGQLWDGCRGRASRVPIFYATGSLPDLGQGSAGGGELDSASGAPTKALPNNRLRKRIIDTPAIPAHWQKSSGNNQSAPVLKRRLHQ